MVEYSPIKYRRSEPTPIISFGENDEEGVFYPHEDAFVVTMLVAKFTTRRILIDNGSSTNILFWEAFTWMGINAARLQPAPMLLKGFSEETVQPIETITLFVLAGNTPCIASIMVDFLVVNAHSSYNTIISPPNPNRLKVITSIYHLKMKFLTFQGVKEIRGEQVLAWECYM